MLRAEGITPIPVEEGLALFRQLLMQRQTTTRIVVAGRLGTAPTLNVAAKPLPFLRFLEKPRVFYPGIELITDIEMSVRTDSYVDEHQLQGQRLVPAVIGLEAIAQVAQAVAGNQDKPSFHDVQFTRPLVIPEQDSVTLRLMALVHCDGTVEVAIRCSETGYQFNHFQAVCRFGAEHEDLVPILHKHALQQTTILFPDPNDLYGSILFHQGRFRRLQHYTYLHAWECVAEITPDTDGAWFARYLPQELILGDPASRDALIHAIQACIPQATLLPVSIESIHFSQQSLMPGQHIQVHARERSRQGNTFIYDMEARDSHGQLLEQWRGLHLQLVNASLPHERWAEALLVPYFERRIAELSPQMEQILLMMRVATDGTSLTLNQLDTDQKICNIQVVRPRSDELWRTLLRTHEYALAQHLSSQTGEDFDTAATRVLAVNELLKVSGLSLDTQMVQSRIEQDGWQMLDVGSHLVLTFVTSVRSQSQPIAFAFYWQPVMDMEQSVSLRAERG